MVNHFQSEELDYFFKQLKECEDDTEIDSVLSEISLQSLYISIFGVRPKPFVINNITINIINTHTLDDDEKFLIK